MGGRKFDDLGEHKFDSPRDFFESSYNSSGDGNDLSVNSYGYAEGYIIPTTQKQDATMRETFIGISEKEEYHLLGNNCVTTVQRTMKSASLMTYNAKQMQIPLDYGINDASVIVVNQPPIIPSSAFNSIIETNPHGLFINRIKKR